MGSPPVVFDTMKLVINWRCNMSCSYCCNKDADVRATFKPITKQELEKTNYKDYELTGGEITMLLHKFR